jgi:transcriptional antiterminator RfaH
LDGELVTGDEVWLALYTLPHKEYLVRDFLLGRQLQVFLPEVRNQVQRRDRPSTRPFFPHYLFIRNPGVEVLADVRWTPGLRRIVAFGGRPVLIPDMVIRHLRKRLETFELADEEPFEKGQVVHIAEGPFEGMDAIFDRRLSGRDRVRVFMELISRVQVPVEMDLQHLVPPR